MNINKISASEKCYRSDFCKRTGSTAPTANNVSQYGHFILFNQLRVTITFAEEVLFLPLLVCLSAFLKRSLRYGFVTASLKFSHCFIQRRKTSLERCSLLITAFIPSFHQSDLSAIYSRPEIMILSCPDVHLIWINDLSS